MVETPLEPVSPAKGQPRSLFPSPRAGPEGAAMGDGTDRRGGVRRAWRGSRHGAGWAPASSLAEALCPGGERGRGRPAAPPLGRPAAAAWAACEAAVSRHASTGGTAPDSSSGSRGLRGWGDSGPPGAAAQPGRTRLAPDPEHGSEEGGRKTTGRSHLWTGPQTDWQGSGGQDAEQLMSDAVKV